MNKTELVDAVASKTKQSKKDTDETIGAMIDAMTAELKNGGKITFVGFGSFEVKERSARTARNPRTGAVVDVPAKKAVTFSVGKTLKELVAAEGVNKKL